MTDHGDLLGDDFRKASPPTPDEMTDDYQKRLQQHCIDFVGEHCQSTRQVTSNGKPIFIGEAGEAQPLSLSDGPVTEGTFRYSGESFDLPPIPWRLLKFMWNRESASVDDVEEFVWAVDAGPSALKSALHKLNDVLCTARFPKNLAQKQGVVLWR